MKIPLIFAISLLPSIGWEISHLNPEFYPSKRCLAITTVSKLTLLLDAYQVSLLFVELIVMTTRKPKEYGRLSDI
jgi:hypothetical protein